MKASITTRYGEPDVLELQELEMPMPRVDEIRVKIHASSVTRADTMMRQGVPRFGRLFLGLTKPKHPITGTGFAGEVVKVGKEVTRFQAGDKVFGESVFGEGTNADYVCMKESGVVDVLPQNITYDAGAPICDGALTSLNFLKNLGNIKQKHSVLIYGASGSLGTAAVQIAKHYGAEVTAVCSSKNSQMVKNLGADHVIDYIQEDFAKSSQKYDIIYDTVGKRSFSDCKQALAKHGIFMSPVLSLSLLFRVMQTAIYGKKKVKFSATGTLPTVELQSLLQGIIGMIDVGALETVIDRRYPLVDIVEAHSYIEKGHKRGNVIISSRLC